MFTSKWISHLFTDHLVAVESQVIKEVTTDSSVPSNDSLFIPIVGENFNGHEFAIQAISNGAIAMLWYRSYQLPDEIGENISVFFVDDTVLAMQKLANRYRNKVNPTVIGVTGSNGKTTTKDLVRHVSQSSFQTHYTHGNFNNLIGLPLTILGMEPHTQVLILEMGMDRFGEIERLSTIANPDYAIITNIGESHIEFLGSREGIAQAKLEILTGMKKEGTLLVDGDEPLLANVENAAHVIRCGFCDHNDVIIAETVFGKEHMHFTLSDGHTYTVPLLGKHHALNATFAITIGRLLGIDDKQIVEALKTLDHTAMRFEFIGGPNGVQLINDAYNASPTSMKAAIEVVRQLPDYNNKVLVLGDILELGEDSTTYHQSIAEAIDSEITAVYTYGKHAKAITDRMEIRTPTVIGKHFHSKDALVKELQGHLTNDTIILFKASRGMQFEIILDSIQELV